MHKKFILTILAALTLITVSSISIPSEKITAYGSVVPHVACPMSGQYKWVNEDGTFASDKWVYTKITSSIGDQTQGWMYFGTDGNVKNGWFTVNGKSYYSEEKRDYEDRTKDTYFILTDSWAPDQYGNLIYYVGADGAMKTGWFQLSDGYWYYSDASGKNQRSTTIDGKYKLDFKGRWIEPVKY